jgi:hypothetical protein
VGIVVESTFNWYWLVDGLMDSGYKVHLASPSAIQQYSGLKHADDKHDAFWLAQMLRLEILPEGYIYPKGERPIRKRGRSLWMNLQILLEFKQFLRIVRRVYRECHYIRKPGHFHIESWPSRPNLSLENSAVFVKSIQRERPPLLLKLLGWAIISSKESLVFTSQ